MLSFSEPMDDYNLLKCFSSSFLLALFETIFAYVSFVYSGTHWEHFNYATLLDDTQWIHNKIMPMLIVVNMVSYILLDNSKSTMSKTLTMSERFLLLLKLF